MSDEKHYGGQGWLALLALSLLAAAGLLFWQQVRLQDRVADYRLGTARQVQKLVETQLSKDLDTRAGLIAGNQAFIGYVTQATGGILPGTVADNASIVDLLEERRSQLGLTIAAVINSQGRLIASRDGISERRDFTQESLFTDAVTSAKTTHGVWFNDHRLFYVTIVPLSTYGADGFLLVGMPVDQALADLLGGTAGTHVVLYANTPKGPDVAASTLPPADTQKLLGGFPKVTGTGDTAYALQVEDTTYRGYTASLFGSDSVRAAVLVATSTGWTSWVEVGLPMMLALVLFLGVALLAVLSTRRALRRQVDTLARIIERAAQVGDYHLRAPETADRVLTPIGVAFNQLMARLRGTKPEPPAP